MTDKGNNRRLAKNTVMLYLRMGFTMLIQLYTSRVLLQVLGIDDYGIWNLVASLIVSISFLTGPLSSATQRFLSTEIGKGRLERVGVIFSQSRILYFIFSIILVILFETIGVWFLNSKLNIPSEDIVTANIVFQLSIFSFIITLMRLPFDSIIIASERMTFYAYISIIEGLLKLGIVYILLLSSSFNHLILYSILILIVSILVTIVYKIYCNHVYPSCRFKLEINKSILKDMASFSGWSLLGSFSVMMSNQGVNIVLNIFFGVAINAAMGITTQVSNAVNQFVTNFQVAFQPQLVKNYASNQIEVLKRMISQTGKFSFVLLFFLAVPLIFYMDPILKFWLGEDVPQYTSQFCAWMIISLLPEALSAPLWMTIQATGQIRNYQLIVSLSFILNIIFSYVLFTLGFPPVSCMYVRCAVSVICWLIRLLFIKKKIHFALSSYLKNVILPILIIIGLSVTYFILGQNIFKMATSNIGNMIINIVIYTILYMFMIYFIILSRTERKEIKRKIFKELNSKLR